MGTEETNIEALKRFEDNAKGIKQVIEEKPVVTMTVREENPSMIDGFQILKRDEMPHNGVFYPNSWEFAYRCPTAKEIANFSTIRDDDQPAMVNAIEELIKKCFVIIDSESGKTINSGQLNDGDRMFLMMLLRQFYLPNKDITYNTMCMLCKNEVEVHFTPSSLQYREISDNLKETFDGRLFTINVSGLEEPITFTIPTLDISSKIFRYLMKVHRDNQTDKDTSKDSLSFNSKFLLISPYLFVTGTESMIQIKQKFTKIFNGDGVLLNSYITIANNMKLENKELIAYTCSCGSEEETLIKFPGGWKNMFVDKSSFGGIF